MSSLFNELKRRNVFRVAAAYLVVSWLLLQIGDVLFEALKLEDSALTILLAFLIIGFIPVVIFSWVYELTPEGVKRESEVSETDSIAHQTGHKLNVITLITVVILIALIIWDRNFEPVARVQPLAEAETVSAGPSIAVLPFEDMSAQGDQEYFGDGIAEELLNVLAKTKGLRVAARTSSFTFKGNQTDIREIGTTLDVKTVLEGSIRKDGDNIRVTAQLINVADGYHIWSESFDRKLDNIFQVQDEIALAIVDVLKLKLEIEDSSHIDISPEAYDLYLRGRNAARIIDKKNQLLAVEFFENAIEIAPNFAEAHAGLASSWIWLEDYGGFPSDNVFYIVAKAARKALSIDSSNSEALMAMGLYFSLISDDNVMAKTMFEYALKENPSLVPIYYHYSDVLTYNGKAEEALKYRKKAVDLDPLSSFYRSRYANQLVSLNRIDEALEQLDIIFSQEPEDTHGLEELANINSRRGDLANAISDYSKVHNNRPGDPYSASFIAIYYQSINMPEKADYWLQQARFRGEDNRWELRAKMVVNSLRQNWQAVYDIGEILGKSDLDVGIGNQGFALLQLGKYDEARKYFSQMFQLINFNPNERISSQNLMALFGQVLLDDLTSQPNKYLDYLKNTVDAVKNEGNFLSMPELHTYYVDACLTMMNDRLNLEEKNIKVAELLNIAIDTGFRQSGMLDIAHCFDPIRETSEFKAVLDRLNELLAEQRAILAN